MMCNANFGIEINGKTMQSTATKTKLKQTKTEQNSSRGCMSEYILFCRYLFTLWDSLSRSTTSTRRRSLSMKWAGLHVAKIPAPKFFGPIKKAPCLRCNPGNDACSIMVCADGCPRGFASCQRHCYEFLPASDRDLMDPRIHSHCPGVLWEAVAAFVRIYRCSCSL